MGKKFHRSYFNPPLVFRIWLQNERHHQGGPKSFWLLTCLNCVTISVNLKSVKLVSLLINPLVYSRPSLRRLLTPYTPSVCPVPVPFRPTERADTPLCRCAVADIMRYYIKCDTVSNPFKKVGIYNSCCLVANIDICRPPIMTVRVTAPSDFFVFRRRLQIFLLT